MGRKSKYVREKESLLIALGKTKLSSVTEEEIQVHLETLKDDEALAAQLLSNWKRATTVPKFREAPEVHPPSFSSPPQPEEEENNVPEGSKPEVNVLDLGIRDALAGPRREKEPVEKGLAGRIDEVFVMCEGILYSTNQQFQMLAEELLGLRMTVCILAGMVGASFLWGVWGERLLGLFLSS